MKESREGQTGNFLRSPLFFPTCLRHPPEPDIPLSPLFFFFLLSFSTINAPDKLEFELIFLTHTWKTHPFGLPHKLASIWCEIWVKSSEPTTFFGGFGARIRHPNTGKSHPCNLTFSCFEISVIEGKIYCFQTPNSISFRK